MKKRALTVESEARRKYLHTKIEASKLKGSVKRRLDDPRTFKQDDIPVLADLYGKRQAEMLRLQKVGVKYGFDVQKKKAR